MSKPAATWTIHDEVAMNPSLFSYMTEHDKYRLKRAQQRVAQIQMRVRKLEQENARLNEKDPALNLSWDAHGKDAKYKERRGNLVLRHVIERLKIAEQNEQAVSEQERKLIESNPFHARELTSLINMAKSTAPPLSKFKVLSILATEIGSTLPSPKPSEAAAASRIANPWTRPAWAAPARPDISHLMDTTATISKPPSPPAKAFSPVPIPKSAVTISKNTTVLTSSATLTPAPSPITTTATAAVTTSAPTAPPAPPAPTAPPAPPASIVAPIAEKVKVPSFPTITAQISPVLHANTAVRQSSAPSQPEGWDALMGSANLNTELKRKPPRLQRKTSATSGKSNSRRKRG
eukprot:GILJ01011567.1.p1 GENE.GILJ01011567.1~~GILJ01011567.1.p1  ORF type:complete len:348 (-),score=42.35 GILJ01011567.1:121-1164(-)